MKCVEERDFAQVFKLLKLNPKLCNALTNTKLEQFLFIQGKEEKLNKNITEENLLLILNNHENFRSKEELFWNTQYTAEIEEGYLVFSGENEFTNFF